MLLYSPAFQQELLRPSLGRGSDLGRKVLVKLVFNFNAWMTRVPLFSPDAPDRVGGDGGDGGAPVGTKAWGHLKFSNGLILCPARNCQRRRRASDRECPEEPHLLPGHLPVVLLTRLLSTLSPVVHLPVVLPWSASQAVLLPRHHSAGCISPTFLHTAVQKGGHRDGLPQEDELQEEEEKTKKEL